MMCTHCAGGTGVYMVLCSCHTCCVVYMWYNVCVSCSCGIMTCVFIFLYFVYVYVLCGTLDAVGIFVLL